MMGVEVDGTVQERRIGSWILIPFNIMISVINAIWIKKIIIIT